MEYKKAPAIDRFMSKVEKTNSCWIWHGATNGGNNKGFKYGFFQMNYRMHYAHRWIWEYTNGPIPDKMVVMHTCDNPLCVNVEHLRLGTQADNIHDRDQKGHNGNLGRVVTAETRAKMSASRKGKKRTDAQKEKQSEAIRDWWKLRKA